MFMSNGNFIFKEVEEKVSAKGNAYSVVKVIDTDNFQHLEFFGATDLKVNCASNAKCKLVLRANKVGYSTSMNCVSVTAL